MPEIFKPRPYQQYAIGQIIEKQNVALMLDMGMGKTVATLTAIQELMYERFEVSKVLVIAPLHVAETTWADECRRWDHLNDLKVSLVLGSLKTRKAALESKADVYTINRENVPWLVDYYKAAWPFDMVVIDESSSFKNPQAKRFKALRKIRARIHRLVELTGTPAPNGLMDLWSQIFLLDRGERLGKTIGEYRRNWFTPGAGYGHVVYQWIPRKGAHKQIYGKIGDICVSMRTEDYISLPPVMYNAVKIQMPRAGWELYKRLERELVLPYCGTDIVASTAAVLSNKLLQMANGAVYDEDKRSVVIHAAKLDALADIEESNKHKPILVFYWFRHDLDRLRERFPEAVPLTTADDIRAWNEGKIPMLLAHPASAGHGLNLQYGGNLVVWFSLTWSLELYQQANKRLHRTGQEKTVIIHHLIAEGTIDEAVMEALKEKRAGQEGMLEAIKAKIGGYRKA